MNQRKFLKLFGTAILCAVLNPWLALAENNTPAAASKQFSTAERKRVVAHVVRVMKSRGLHRHPRKGPYYSGYYGAVFTVEMYFDMITLSHLGDTSLCQNMLLRMFLDRQDASGFIPRYWAPGDLDILQPGTIVGRRAIYKKYQGNPWAIYQSEEHAQPFLCQVALFLTRCQGGDHSWLSDEDYQKLKKYLEHWLVEWDRDANGLCEWASAQHGMGDGQFDRAGVWRSFFCEGADLNSLLHLEFLAAEQIALAKGRVEDAAWFAEQAATKERLVQNLLWDEQDGFFYDRDNRTGGKIRVKAVHGLYPLWTGTATQQQADRIVKEHILNRAEFWSPFPLASYALNEPNYTQLHIPSLVIGDYCMLPQGHCNWRGGMWPHSNYMVAHGLARYGFKKEALELADRSFAVAASDRKIHEWYNAETGQPLGNHPLCAGPQVLMRMLRTELDTDFDPSAIGKTNSRVDSSRLRNALGLTEPFLETQTQNKP